jgi:hypothetical protein
MTLRNINAQLKSSFRDTHLCVGYDVQLHIGESILPVAMLGDEQKHWGYGFRVRARARPGMTTHMTLRSRDTMRPSFANHPP